VPELARARAIRVVTASVAAMTLLAAAGCSSSSKQATTPPSSSTTAAIPRATRPLNTAVAVPEVIGPVRSGSPDIPMNAMLASYKSRYGYQESEFFMQGTATSYNASGALGADDKWSVVAGTKAAYKTRLIVRTPVDPKKFNGTVIVEWLNVTSGRDADPDFGFAAPELLRDGFAYVGVTAQVVGVSGGAALPIPDYHPKALVDQNPPRYKSLHHPGDQYSYDIFSQAAQAILHPSGPNPLGSLRAARLIAAGESQSASRLVTYVDAIAPITNIYDGFMIHSRGGSGTELGPGPADASPKIAHIRADLRVPVMMLATETDLFGLRFYKAFQPDTKLIRTWQMAGTSHVDQSTLDYGVASGRQWDKTSVIPDFQKLCGSLNDGPEQYLVRGAFAALNAWVANGIQPAHSPAFSVVGGAIARDVHGDAIGGIRTPAVDVPTESLSGEFDPSKSFICSLFGSRSPFTTATLKQLYPTHADYVTKVKTSAAAAVKAGFLLAPDAATIDQQAQDSPY
jgi:hypothetical protein